MITASDAITVISPPAPPLVKVEASILATILGNFLMSCGLLLADVCTDTMCVERAKLESDEVKGTLQSAGYTYRAVGMIIGAVLGAIFSAKLYLWYQGNHVMACSLIIITGLIFALVFKCKNNRD
jgi:hypothetical protein